MKENKIAMIKRYEKYNLRKITQVSEKNKSALHKMTNEIRTFDRLTGIA